MTELHSEIQTGIINYLSAHPEACASVQGICNQWLSNEKYLHNIDQVKTAVNGLLLRGEIHRHVDSNKFSL